MSSGLLTLLIFTPLIALLILLLPKVKSESSGYITVVACGVQLLMAVFIYVGFDASAGLQAIEKYPWVLLNLGNFGWLSIDYHVGVDSLNVSLLLLSAVVLTVGAISSLSIKDMKKGYFALYLLLSSTIMGCFAALDFFLFYLFFELMLLPMYFLIGLWGGPRREYASIKFLLYTLFGSLFILIAIIGLYISVIDPAATAVQLELAGTLSEVTPAHIHQVHELLAGNRIPAENLVRTFNIILMQEPANYIPGSILSKITDFTLFDKDPRLIAFLFLLIGFLIKLPAVPVHTWLPDAHVEAPTPISIVLAGILLKVGGYGIMRTAFSIFPEGAMAFAYLIGLIGVISIIYGAFNAIAMKDLKKMIAYSSVSHMGFVLLGLSSLTAEGFNGVIYMMVSHGILASLLFLSAGVIYDRTHDRQIENYRGLATKMPKYTTVVTIAFFASLGLPGFSGFISELFVLLGAFKGNFKWMAIAGAFGIVLGAVYFLWTLQKMFFGRFWYRGKTENSFQDLTARELAMMVPLIFLTLLLGLFPDLLLSVISPGLAKFVASININ